jgi:nicotinamide-nucleotide amidase
VIVETLAIGTELLLGQIVNTNASSIAAKLADSGLTHLGQAVVGDNEVRIERAVLAAVDRSDALIITGGIGPTQDDITREVVASAAGVPLVFDALYAESMRERSIALGRDFPESNLRQAYRPEGAVVIDNHKGSAPGFRVQVGDLPSRRPCRDVDDVGRLRHAVPDQLVRSQRGSGGQPDDPKLGDL